MKPNYGIATRSEWESDKWGNAHPVTNLACSSARQQQQRLPQQTRREQPRREALADRRGVCGCAAPAEQPQADQSACGSI